PVPVEGLVDEVEAVALPVDVGARALLGEGAGRPVVRSAAGDADRPDVLLLPRRRERGGLAEAAREIARLASRACPRADACAVAAHVARARDPVAARAGVVGEDAAGGRIARIGRAH